MKEYIGIKYKNGSLKFYCFDDKVLVGLISENVENVEINNESVEKIYNLAINLRKEYEGIDIQ